jgi:hypothetical protein
VRLLFLATVLGEDMPASFSDESAKVETPMVFLFFVILDTADIVKEFEKLKSFKNRKGMKMNYH